MPGCRVTAALAAILVTAFAAEALADPPWARGRHRGHHGSHHGRHHGQGYAWGPPPVVVVPAPAWRPPPVVVIPGYAVPYPYYGYSPGWGYAPHGEAELRLRIPFR